MSAGYDHHNDGCYGNTCAKTHWTYILGYAGICESPRANETFRTRSLISISSYLQSTDSFCYTYTIIVILALLLLTFNLIKAWRTQNAIQALHSSSASIKHQPNHLSSGSHSIQLSLPNRDDEKGQSRDTFEHSGEGQV